MNRKPERRAGRWLPVLLALSLAGNGVGIALFGIRQLRHFYTPPVPADVRTALSGLRRLDQRVLVERFRWPLDSLKTEMELLKHDLQYLHLSASGDTARARQLLDRRAALQKQIYRLMLESAWAARELPEPRRRRMLGLWREMTGLPESDSAQTPARGSGI